MFIIKHKLERGPLGFAGGDGGSSASSGSESNMDDSSNTGGTFGSDGSFTSGGDAASQAANSPGGYSTNADGSYSTDAGTYSDNPDGSVSFTPKGEEQAQLSPPGPTFNNFYSPWSSTKGIGTLPGATPRYSSVSEMMNKAPLSVQEAVESRVGAAQLGQMADLSLKDAVSYVSNVNTPDLLTEAERKDKRTPTFLGKRTVDHPDVISEKNKAEELGRRAAAAKAEGISVVDRTTQVGKPSQYDNPNYDPDFSYGPLDYAAGLYKAYQNKQKDAAERVGKDIKGLFSGRPMEYLGEVAHPTVNIPGVTQSVYSNVPGAHIDSLGRYNTNPDYDYAPSNMQYGGDQYGSSSTPGLPVQSSGTQGVTGPTYTPPSVADAPLHNTASSSYTSQVIMINGVPHYKDVTGKLIKFAGY